MSASSSPLLHNQMLRAQFLAEAYVVGAIDVVEGKKSRDWHLQVITSARDYLLFKEW